MAKKKEVSLVEIYFPPPGENWIYYNDLKLWKGTRWPDVHDRAVSYYEDSGGRASIPVASWEETINILFSMANEERRKEINLLKLFIDTSKWQNLSPIGNFQNLIDTYSEIIPALNEFLGNKDLYEFSKAVNNLRAERRSATRLDREVMEDPLILVKKFTIDIIKQVEESIFTNSDALVKQVDFIQALRRRDFDSVSDQIIKNIQVNFKKGMLESKNKLVKFYKEFKNPTDIALVNFLEKFFNKGNPTFEKIVDNYSKQMSGKNFLLKAFRDPKLISVVNNQNFSQQDYNELIKKIEKSFSKKVSRTSGLISKMTEEIIPYTINQIKFDNGLMTLSKTLSNDTFSLDNIAIISDNSKIQKAVSNFADSRESKNKGASREEYQELITQLEKIVGEIENVHENYHLINLNVKNYAKDTKFSAGNKRKIEDISFMLSEVTEPRGFISRLAQFGKGFIFHREAIGEDKIIVDVLGKLLIYIGGFLFEGFRNIGGKATHQGINVLYLNQMLVPFSYFLYTLAESLSSIKNSLESEEIKATSGGGGKSRSVQVFEQNGLAHLNVHVVNSMMPVEERRVLYEKSGARRGSMDYYKPAWEEQSRKAFENITIQASFFNKFEQYMKNILK